MIVGGENSSVSTTFYEAVDLQQKLRNLEKRLEDEREMFNSERRALQLALDNQTDAADDALAAEADLRDMLTAIRKECSCGAAEAHRF